MAPSGSFFQGDAGNRAHSGARGPMDPWAILLWFAAVMVAAMALPAANWADNLGVVPMVAAAGLGLGLVLVGSGFGGAVAAVLGLGYGAAFILWEMTAVLDPGMAWRDRALNLAGRVSLYFMQVLSGEPSHDSLMFVVLMAIVFWLVAVFGTWFLLRRGFLWFALSLPGLAVFLNVYYYRYGERLQIYLPVFVLIALALIVRTELVGKKTTWERIRAQVPSDVAGRVTQAGVVAALVLVLVAWMGPVSTDAGTDGLVADAPSYNPLGEIFSDALAGLRSPVNLYGETFADSLTLGAGLDPGNRAIFQAALRGEVPSGSRPYWRARAFDTYLSGKWTTTIGEEAVYRPREAPIAEVVDAGRTPIEFSISPFIPAMKLLYVPARVDWVNRTVSLREVVAEGRVVDVLEASSSDVILPGESYRVRSTIPAPTIAELRQAGTDYPNWVVGPHLQVPDDLPESVRRLAIEIAGLAPTPHAKAEAIVTWLRENITYQRVTEAPPEGRDPLEWFLLDSRVGFCDYYATAAVMMLRSIGVPARFSVGYASGVYDQDANLYYVAASDTHSWPEVYFPGFGWVEFEPTVSQPPLVRPEGEGDSGLGPSEAVDLPADELQPAGDAGLEEDVLRGLPEDVDVPEALVHPFRWIPYVFLALASLLVVILVSPARAVAARVTVAGTRRAGLQVPSWLEDWASPPKTEAGRIYQRLTRWPVRLGIAPDRPDATPHEVGAALGNTLAQEQVAIDQIVDAYAAERYGGHPAPKGLPSKSWRGLRFRLYRAWVAKLLDDILGI